MIEVEGLSKSFPTEQGERKVLDNVNFRVNTGEFVSVIGPSGCGKSTLLHIIAGIDEATSGTVKIDSNANSPKLGHVGYMQQKDLLFPWRSVLDNAILGLEINGMFRDEARQKAIGIIDTFGFSDLDFIKGD